MILFSPDGIQAPPSSEQRYAAKQSEFDTGHAATSAFIHRTIFIDRLTGVFTTTAIRTVINFIIFATAGRRAYHGIVGSLSATDCDDTRLRRRDGQ